GPSFFNVSLFCWFGCPWSRLNWMRRGLVLTVISLAEKVNWFLASEMGRAEDVCPRDAWGPDTLSGVEVPSRKHIAQAADYRTSERKGSFTDGVRNCERPTRYLNPRLVGVFVA